MFMRFVCANILCASMIRTHFHLNSPTHTPKNHTHTHTQWHHFPHFADCSRTTLIYSPMGSYSFRIIQFTVPTVSEVAGNIDRIGGIWFCNKLRPARLCWQLGLVFGDTCMLRDRVPWHRERGHPFYCFQCAGQSARHAVHLHIILKSDEFSRAASTGHSGLW